MNYWEIVDIVRFFKVSLFILTLIKTLACLYFFVSLLCPSIVCANDVDKRIAFIQGELDYASKYSHFWQEGWVAASAVATALSFYEYKMSDDAGKRYDGLIYGVLGAASLQANIREPLLTHRYAQQLSNMPQSSVNEALLKLARAEEMMTLAAQREMSERSGASRMRSLSLNLLASLLIAYDDKRPKQAVRNFILYSLAAEVKTFTTPLAMTSAKQRYDAGDYISSPDLRRLSFMERISLSAPNGRQLQLEMKF